MMEYCTNSIIKELLCSDDRSPEVFTRIIESSTQMQAVLTPTTKPNCLIIDEIDGAPTVSSEHIIFLVFGKGDCTCAVNRDEDPRRMRGCAARHLSKLD